MHPIATALLVWFVILALLIGFVAGAGESSRIRPDPLEPERVRRIERAWLVRTLLIGIVFIALFALPFIGHGRALRHFIGG
jgi:hypothetical protein